jgi:hypothetical protein
VELVDFIDLDDHLNKSSAYDEWLLCKDIGKRNRYMDAIMSLPGRDEVKGLFLDVFNSVTRTKASALDITKEDYSIAFLGRPGQGELSPSLNFYQPPIYRGVNPNLQDYQRN